jgi:hypothetical protein
MGFVCLSLVHDHSLVSSAICDPAWNGLSYQWFVILDCCCVLSVVVIGLVLLGAFLVFNLIVTMIVVHRNNYTIPRVYGVWLIVLYVCYDVVLVLFGTGILGNQTINN